MGIKKGTAVAVPNTKNQLNNNTRHVVESILKNVRSRK